MRSGGTKLSTPKAERKKKKEKCSDLEKRRYTCLKSFPMTSILPCNYITEFENHAMIYRSSIVKFTGA